MREIGERRGDRKKYRWQEWKTDIKRGREEGLEGETDIYVESPTRVQRQAGDT